MEKDKQRKHAAALLDRLGLSFSQATVSLDETKRHPKFVVMVFDEKAVLRPDKPKKWKGYSVVYEKQPYPTALCC